MNLKIPLALQRIARRLVSRNVLIVFAVATLFLVGKFIVFSKSVQINSDNVKVKSEDFLSNNNRLEEDLNDHSFKDQVLSIQDDISFFGGILGKIFAPDIVEKKIIKVPEDYSRIQDAIDTAKGGDVIMVSAGEYKENLVMKDGISVIGAGADVTILDGQKLGNVAVFKGLSDKSTRLENFTLKNSGENLSGVFIEDSSPVINRNIILDNDYDIYIKGNSSPTIQKNKLSGSKAGVQIFNLEYISGYRPVVVDNVIYKNKKGINIYNGEALIEHNTVSFNSYYKDDLGATFGIYFASASGAVKNNIVTDNGNCELCSGVYADEKSKDVVISYNDLWNNKNNFVCFGDCLMEENNFSEDPEFLSEENYVLDENSEFINSASDGQRLGARL